MSRLIGKVESGIYTGTRIFKDKAEIEYKAPISFYLNDVCVWEYYAFTDAFTNRVTEGDKMFVELPRSTYIILEDFDAFNKIMSEYNKTRLNFRLQ